MQIKILKREERLMKETILNKAMQAKEASRFIARASTDKKNKIILRMADYIRKKKMNLLKLIM